MSTTSRLPLASTQAKIDYELILDCVHCGLCTASCPTYVENSNEADSPRGRIYLMRGVIDGKLELDDNVKKHLDLCLNCRACETACPSGVQYGRLIEPFRDMMNEHEPGRSLSNLSRLQRWMLFNIFPSRSRTRLALAPARLSQWIGVDWLMRKSGLLNLLPKSLRTMHGMLPPLKETLRQAPGVAPRDWPKACPRRAVFRLRRRCDLSTNQLCHGQGIATEWL